MPTTPPAHPLLFPRSCLSALATPTLCILLLLFGTILARPAAAGAVSPDGWELIEPPPQVDVLYGVTWGGGQFVAVGSAGTIITSQDGRTWTVRYSGVTNTLYSIAWNDKRYIAVGAGGVILTSTDGINWSPEFSGTVNDLHDVTSGDGAFVAVGDMGTVLTRNSDGTWLTQPAPYIGAVWSIIWVNGQYYASGSPGLIVASQDAIQWTVVGYGEQCQNDLASNGTIFVSLGVECTFGVPPLTLLHFISTGIDGGNWVITHQDGGELNSALWVFDKFITVGKDGRMLVSADGITWTYQSSGVTSALYGIAWSGSTAVVVGAYGTILLSHSQLSSNVRQIPALDFIATIILAMLVFAAGLVSMTRTLNRSELSTNALGCHFFPINKFFMAILSAALMALAILFTFFQDARADSPTTTDGPDYVADELIVLLMPASHGNPTAAEVVDMHARGIKIPENLGLGNPKEIEFAVRRHTPTDNRVFSDVDYTNPRIRLSQYIIVRYPSVINVTAIETALNHNPHIASVERNYLFNYASSVNDPYFAPKPAGPFSYQWGLHALNIPAAWDYVSGRANIGVIDTGIDLGHEDLAPIDADGGYTGGNFRPHLSHSFENYWSDDSCDNDPQPITCLIDTNGYGAGHGNMVAGIIAAVTDNATGVAGVCKNCSLMITRGTTPFSNLTSQRGMSNGLVWLIDHGAQTVNISHENDLSGCPTDSSDWHNYYLLCDTFSVATESGVILVSVAGNDKMSKVYFPGNDDRVIAVGGIEPDGDLWDELDGDSWDEPELWGSTMGCSSLYNQDANTTFQCGSNYGTALDLVAPAKGVYSTVFPGVNYASPLCRDDSYYFDPVTQVATGSGYGTCTGTSFSAPHVAGIIGLLQSANPLLNKSDIYSLLINYSSQAGNRTDRMGYGIPDAEASVKAALGTVNGKTVDNRLTPLFSLYSETAQHGDHLYTTVPQVGAAAVKPVINDIDGNIYMPTYRNEEISIGADDVHGYGYFPGAECMAGPCPPTPKAQVYIFSSDRSPYPNISLVPLYRMSYESTDPSQYYTSHAYTTETAGISMFKSVGYRLDGIEGYIFPSSLTSAPPGTEKLYRRYNSALGNDYILALASDLPTVEARGYTGIFGNSYIGYAYPNIDSDSDTLIDGFELLLGTNPYSNDSDGDGTSDGVEYPIAGIPSSDPCALVTLYNSTIYGSQSHKGCNITLGPTLTIQAQANVALQATRDIKFLPGTQIDEGANVTAIVTSP